MIAISERGNPYQHTDLVRTQLGLIKAIDSVCMSEVSAVEQATIGSIASNVNVLSVDNDTPVACMSLVEHAMTAAPGYSNFQNLYLPTVVGGRAVGACCACLAGR